MSEQEQSTELQKSAAPPVIAKVAPAASESTKLDLLLQLLLSREARTAEAEQNAETARKARNAQRELSARTHVEKQLVKQARCRHMKGGKKGPRSGVVDYAVYLHTYINGESIIKCFLCQMKWKAKDTVENLVRGGRQIANHTKIGWAQAVGFLSQSTNTASSSEVPMEAKPSVPFNGQEL
jgi:hypothetical protein